LGLKGIRHLQFTRELYTTPQQQEKQSTDNERNLNLFVHNTPFNFTLKQALDSLGDPGILAKVVRLRTLIAHVWIYSELAQAMQELSDAIHKFQKCFNDKTSQVIIQLKETPGVVLLASNPWIS
jgi:hypothetical protein